MLFRSTVGWFDAPNGVIDAPIGRDVRDATRMAVRNDGKSARTHYEVLRRFSRPTESSLVHCTLETGRTHQIRVHLGAVGHPVIGDATYGGVRAAIPFTRPALHAERLSFGHPSTGETITCDAPIPEDMRALIDRLSEGH